MPQQKNLGPVTLTQFDNMFTTLFYDYTIGKHELLNALRNLHTKHYKQFVKPDHLGNEFDSFNAISCNDRKNPTSSKPYVAAAQNDPNAPPYVAANNIWIWAAACRYITPKQDPVTVQSNAKIILLSNTYDAATPLSGALAARKQLPNSRLIQINKAIGRGVEDYSQCQLKILSDYFTNNTLPADAGGQKADVIC